MGDPAIVEYFDEEVRLLLKNLGILTPYQKGKVKQKFLSDRELKLYMFQTLVLSKAHMILKGSSGKEQTSSFADRKYVGLARKKQPMKYEKRLRHHVDEIVKRVMEKTVIIAPQMEDEVGCELQRLAVLLPYWKFLEKLQICNNNSLKDISVKLEILLDPTKKFEDELDKKVRLLLKESEQFVGGLGITESEKIIILKAMGLKQGHWYKCPNGHIYCIADCGGAVVESTCPSCGNRIGGANHRLRSDNAVATEMDGSRVGAWSEQNNLRNYDLGNQ
ncbi:NFX1-type zinc finger-containing protein 1 [Halocaridina rubra]|uniref:NFX1-type zinc finger-containing protein 1 n=1 Tax=Halocaridina rubra TaxID=373956 RepID=A0AAN8ZNM3_HALRR